MKLIPVLLAGFLALTATSVSAQNSTCKVETKTDEATKNTYSHTQDEVMVSSAGRRWVYFMRKDDSGLYSLVLKYAQTDMPYVVKNGASLTLTTTSGSTISMTVPKGEHGFLRNNKGVKSWSVTLPVPLNANQFSDIQNSDIASMTLELEKGQANTKVHESKKGMLRDLAKCISQ